MWAVAAALVVLAHLCTAVPTTQLTSNEASSSRVSVVFYGEAFCPNCISFVGGPLNTTLTAEGMWEVIDYQMVPWGNAYFNISACGTASYNKDNMFCWIDHCGSGAKPPIDPNCFSGVEVCQHGAGECYADTVEACIIEHYSPQVYTQFVYCFEYTNSANTTSMEGCALQLGIDWQQVVECANGTKGHDLNVANAKRTIALGDSKLGTPWVLVNGKTLDDVGDLMKTVCENVPSGQTKPAVCAKAGKMSNVKAQVRRS